MNPLVLAGCVGLASFFTLNALASGGIAAWWQWRRPRPLDADHLLLVKLAPALGSLALTLCVVVPPFLRPEPAHAHDGAGPLLLALSAAGALVLAAAVQRVAGALVITRRLRRGWLAASSALPAADAGVPARLVEVPYPLVGVIGIARPMMVVSRMVQEGCADDELRLIAAHERAHLRACDNLKRLLIDGCPDVLRHTAAGRALDAAWAAAVEDAADDAAAGADRGARMTLARALLRVARMAVGAPPAARPTTALVDAAGVARRVRRLAESGPRPLPSRLGLYLTLGGVATALALASIHDGFLLLTHATAEMVVEVGK